MKLQFHRKEQWDLGCWPLLCVRRNGTNRAGNYESSRVFCLWLWGIQIGSWLWCRKGPRHGK